MLTDKKKDLAIELAWGIIANVGGGDWDKETKEWKEAAIKWRDCFISEINGEDEEQLRLDDWYYD